MVDGLWPCGLSSFLPDLVAALPSWRHVVVVPPGGRLDHDTVGMVQLSGAEVLVANHPVQGRTLSYGNGPGDYTYGYGEQMLVNHGTGRRAYLPPAVSDVLFRMAAFHSDAVPSIAISTADPWDVLDGWLERYISGLPPGLEIVSSIDIGYPHRSMRISPMAFRRQMLDSGIFLYVPRKNTIRYGRALYEALAMGLAVMAPRMPVFTSVFPEDSVAYFGTPDEAAEWTRLLYGNAGLRNSLVHRARRIAVGRCLRNYMAEVEGTMEAYGQEEVPVLGIAAQAGRRGDRHVSEVSVCGGAGAGAGVPCGGDDMAVGSVKAGEEAS